MQHYSRLCEWLARLMMLMALGALAIIVVSLAIQVLFRYGLGGGFWHTDEIAQAMLVWLTFTGAALLYRERGHIEVDFFVTMFPRWLAASIAIVIEIAIIYCFYLVAQQILQTRPMMERVFHGHLKVSRFLLHMLPLLICSVCTIMFAVEAIWRHWQRARGSLL